MTKKYLVNLACHLNSEEKKNYALKVLSHLKDFGVDVCVSLHSSDYLSELAKLSNFVYFDANNEIIKKEDIVNNSDLIDENFNKYGIAPIYHWHDFGLITNNCIHSCPHSKSALALFKNGISIGLHHDYQYVIYLEYDLPIPKKGYKSLIEEKIQLLEKQDADAFFYRVSQKHLGGLYGGMVIAKSNIILRSRLLCEDWHSSVRNWIKHWHCTYFEKTIETILYSERKFKTIEHDIDEVCVNDWGVDRQSDFNGSLALFYKEKNQDNYDIDAYKELHYKINLFNVYICPYKIKNSNDYKLYMYIRNDSRRATAYHVKVYADDSILYEKNGILHGTCWFFDTIDTPNVNFYSEIKMEYSVTDSSGERHFKEKFLYKNISKIYEKLIRLETNSA